jgi:hypothetical protein
MSSVLYESPMMLVLGLLLAAGLVLFIWTQVRVRQLLTLAIVLAVLAVVPLILDALVETERESVFLRLHEIAYQVRRNDLDGFLRYIDPSAHSVRERVLREFPDYRFKMCNILGVHEFTTNPNISGEATIKFRVAVVVDDLRIEGDEDIPVYLRDVKMSFRKDASDKWMVTAFDHYPIQQLQQLIDGN